jgi:hypothetical protein
MSQSYFAMERFIWVIFIICIAFVTPSYGQTKKWRDSKKIEVVTGYKRPFPVYGSISVKQAPFDGNSLTILGGSVGILPENWLMVGGDLEVFVPKTHKENRFMDSETNIVGGTAGLRIEAILWSTEKFHLIIPYTIGYVFAGYYTSYNAGSERETWFYGDRSIKHEPGIGVETNISPNFRISLNYSYRFNGKLDLPNTPVYAFNGHNIGLHFKLGNFHALYPYSRGRYVN